MNLCRLGSYRLGSIRIFPPAFQTASLQANSQTYKCLYSIWCFSRQWGFVWSHHWGEVIYLCKWFKPIGPRVLSFVLSNLWVHIIVTLHKSWWHFGICSKHFSFLNSPFESDFYHRLLYTIKGPPADQTGNSSFTCNSELHPMEFEMKTTFNLEHVLYEITTNIVFCIWVRSLIQSELSHSIYWERS